jgi:signal peptidase
MRVLARATTLVRRVIDVGLLALIVVVACAVILGKGAPLVGRETIVIGGASMEPTIPLGAAIVVGPVDPAGLAVGDVVSMQIASEHATYTHRIVDVVDRPDGRWIRTKGDANPDPDPTLVPASAVIGRVELAVPLMGYLLALLSLPVGVIFVLGLAATLLAIAWLLESLEPERVTVTTITRRVPEADASPGPAAADSAAANLVAADPAAVRGEPIAARSGLIPRRAGAAFTAAFAGPAGTGSASVARPTVREQIRRSRATRDRRARWLSGRGDRPTSD